jgi:hypothetical protein
MTTTTLAIRTGSMIIVKDIAGDARSSFEQGVSLLKEFFARRHDGIAPYRWQRHGDLPSIATGIHKKRVPHRVGGGWHCRRSAAVQQPREVCQVSLSRNAFVVPVVQHARIDG